MGDEMVSSFNLTECQVSTRQHLFQWADIMAQKRFLCEGCYDPICGVRGIMEVGRCLFDSMEPDDAEIEADSVADSVAALLVTARDGAKDDAAVLVLVAAAVLILAAKRRLDAAKAEKTAVPKFAFFEQEIERQ